MHMNLSDSFITFQLTLIIIIFAMKKGVTVNKCDSLFSARREPVRLFLYYRVTTLALEWVFHCESDVTQVFATVEVAQA